MTCDFLGYYLPSCQEGNNAFLYIYWPPRAPTSGQNCWHTTINFRQHHWASNRRLLPERSWPPCAWSTEWCHCHLRHKRQSAQYWYDGYNIQYVRLQAPLVDNCWFALGQPICQDHSLNHSINQITLSKLSQISNLSTISKLSNVPSLRCPS